MHPPRNAAHELHPVTVPEDVGALRRAVSAMEPWCPGLAPGDVALVATELATNLVRHTNGGGYVLYRQLAGGIEVVAVDHGPGLPVGMVPGRIDPDGAKEPRRGGLGIGLAVVVNLSTTVDVYSRPEGTVVLARLLPGGSPATAWCRWGAVTTAVDYDGRSGDGWAVADRDGSAAALIVDGLGHGAPAEAAAWAAVEAFEREPPGDLAAFVHRAHDAMRSTRGGVLGVCTIEPERNEARFIGVGNVTGRILMGGDSRSLVSREGTVGTHVPVPRSREGTYAWGPGATLVLASDGLRSQWDPRSYPGLLGHDPVVVAAVLHRDFARPNDDTAVLVLEDLRRVA